MSRASDHRFARREEVERNIANSDEAWEGSHAHQRANRLCIVDRVAEDDKSGGDRNEEDAFAQVRIRADLVADDRLDKRGVDFNTNALHRENQSKTN